MPAKFVKKIFFSLNIFLSLSFPRFNFLRKRKQMKEILFLPTLQAHNYLLRYVNDSPFESLIRPHNPLQFSYFCGISNHAFREFNRPLKLEFSYASTTDLIYTNLLLQTLIRPLKCMFWNLAKTWNLYMEMKFEHPIGDLWVYKVG